ncbi:MAG: hypothetical protein MUD16_11275 [Desulfobacterales bacterium]|jgi:hypothetical protein|nr:hypothetical protein [Desulfobacterales bacterium]
MFNMRVHTSYRPLFRRLHALWLFVAILTDSQPRQHRVDGDSSDQTAIDGFCIGRRNAKLELIFTAAANRPPSIVPADKESKQMGEFDVRVQRLSVF